MSRDWKCKLCGTRASAFGSYETCRVDGPPHEWEEFDDGPCQVCVALQTSGMGVLPCSICDPTPTVHVRGCIVPGCPGCTDGSPVTEDEVVRHTCRYEPPENRVLPCQGCATETDLWRRFAASCMECGAEPREPPEEIVPWWCPACEPHG
jgi:hypothetical protein